ncbi:MAG: cupin domain-containing protein [Cellvibrionaceae bacterium]
MNTPTILKTDIEKEYYFDEGCYILEYSNSAADPNLSIARARVVPNTATQLHKLKNTIERYIILEGRGEVTLGNATLGKNTHSVVEAGDVVIIPKECPQAIRNTGDNDLIFLVICTPRFTTDNYLEC